ncbi:MAG: ParD-like family protein [Treponema sp.]|nr:ParD-like family protein [Treponema sp.]
MAQTTIQLSNEMILEASKYASVYTRSLSMQIEHWARIGKIAEENPDLPYTFIEDALIGKAELDNGNVMPFEFRQI